MKVTKQNLNEMCSRVFLNRRKLLGLTLRDVADEGGVSHATLCKAENHQSGIMLWTFLCLAKSLRIRPVALLKEILQKIEEEENEE